MFLAVLLILHCWCLFLCGLHSSIAVCSRLKYSLLEGGGRLITPRKLTNFQDRESPKTLDAITRDSMNEQQAIAREQETSRKSSESQERSPRDEAW